MMYRCIFRAVSLILLWALPTFSFAQEERYYKITTLPIPEDAYLEVGALEMLPDGQLAVASRRGEIYLVRGAESEDAAERAEFTRFAHGLHEVLGLAYRDGWLYLVQRGEVSRLRDENGDGRADLFETVSDGWDIGGDYHEYAFGSKFDRDGFLWVTLCLTGSFSSDVKYRGWCLRVAPDGTVIPTCSGIRSPGGMGMNAAGDVFYTDNQGPWNGTCHLKHLAPGSFQGHTGSLKWYDEPSTREVVLAAMGPKPELPKSGSRIVDEAASIPELMPPVVSFPYDKMGKSASGIACDLSQGRFGPFTGQLFVADQSHSTIMRVFLEKVAGRYQGACFMFREGFASGNLALELTEKGQLFVGGTNRGWGSRGNRPFALERLDWTGETPFEIHEMRARPDGFELTFTKPLDAATAEDLAAFEMTSYTYIYQSSYGSPEVDHREVKIERAEVGGDGRSVRLFVDELTPGHIHELHLPGMRSSDGKPLLHATAYYTLNTIPEVESH